MDLRTAELRRSGEPPQKLSDQPFQILAMLVEHPGDLVTRDEIRNSLWPNGTIVEFEHSINAAMNRLRLALGDSAENPRFIETLARRGYRWKTPVDWVETSRETEEPAKPESAAILPPPANGNWIGKKVSHYRVLEILGGGGMGVVYRAEDLKLGRRVALKFLPEELANDLAAMQRFEREARAASALNHPNICTIYEVEEHEGQPFLVMELLEGRTLRELIPAEENPPPKGLPIPLPLLLDVSVQIAAGLEAAHSKGIVHRDIKPANIFVTSAGQVKILDFGVAKLQVPETSEQQPRGTEAPQSKKVWTPYLTLTRTGTPIGTAGYMSPEQIRSEKLDARTDLFNLGLVLYEMAAGRRAFSGESAPALQSAILNSTPASVRELHPEIPSKLEGIITKALEKDRERRYPSAAQLRAELDALKRGGAPRRFASQVRGILLGAAALLWIAGALVWNSRRYASGPPAPREPMIRQLTTNSFENRVTSGAISPNGKFMAYCDTKGLYIQLTDTGETRAVPQPEEFRGQDLAWECAFWFPDSTAFVVNAHRSGMDPLQWDSAESSIWMASVLGGAPRKLRDHASANSVSPDGSRISFGTNSGEFGDREMWLMDLAGEHPRKLFDADEGSGVSGFSWSQDGKRAVYLSSNHSGDTLLSLAPGNSLPTVILSPREMERVSYFYLRVDGRLLYSVAEPDSYLGNSCNLWQMPLDATTGKPLAKPSRITDWSGFCMSYLSESSDGKKFAFLKLVAKQTSYLADLAAGGSRILHPRHFPLSESSEGIVDWVPDSKAVFVISDRSGQFGIYKESLDQDLVEPVLTEGYAREAHATPDGKSIVYLGVGEKGQRPGLTMLTPRGGPEPVMRVSAEGGPSQRLFTARPYSSFFCARSPSRLCVIGEPDDEGKHLTVSVLDPEKGRGPELFRFGLVPDDNSWWLALSPDGTRIALTRTAAGPIYILSLEGKTLQEVSVKGWSNLLALTWAADGKGLLVTAGVRNGRELLYVDLQGNGHVLWENIGASGETLAHPSPDGRHLALDGWTTTGNMWLMENF